MHPNDLNEELPQEYNPDQAYFKDNVFFSWETVQRILLLISLPLTSMLVAVVIVSIMMNSSEPLQPVSNSPATATTINSSESSNNASDSFSEPEKHSPADNINNNNNQQTKASQASHLLASKEREKEIEQTLQRCQLYRRTGRLMTPSKNSDDNALACYRKVIALDSDNKEAKEGLVKLEETYVRRTNEALKSGGSVKRIESYIRQLRTINPNSKSLPELERRLKSFQAVERDYGMNFQ